MDRLGGTIKEETILGDLEFTQYYNKTREIEIKTIDITNILPNYYYLSKDHFRYEIVTISPSNETALGGFNCDGTAHTTTYMPELAYDNSSGIISVTGGAIRIRGSVGSTHFLCFKTIRVIYRGLDS